MKIRDYLQDNPDRRRVNVLEVYPHVTKHGDVYMVVRFQKPDGTYHSLRFKKMESIKDFIDCNLK